MDFIQSLKNSENLRQDLIDIRNAMTDNQIELIISNETYFLSLVSSEDSKIRKVVCEILGKTKHESYKKIIFDAYLNETQLMVKPSILKALSLYAIDEYLDVLNQREAELVEELVGENAKHAKEELRVLRKLLQPYRTLKKHEFIGFENEVPLILTIPAGHHEALMDELVGYETKKVGLGVQIKAKDIESLFECRLFSGMYFPVCKAASLSVKDIASDVTIKKILRFLDKCHEGEGAYRFRLDLEDSSLSKDLAQTIESHSNGRLQNYPGDYEVEIRIRENLKKEAVIYLKLLTIIDPRFTYRKQASSSSLASHTAALIAHYLQDYVKPDGQLLDPMCNDGTLLIERTLMMPPHFVMGLDFSQELMEKAKLNANDAFVDIRFVQRDLRTFTHQRLFDEMICQLPSVRKKEESANEEKLYQLTFSKVKDLMAVGGIFAVYSKENDLVSRAYNKNRSYLQLKKCIPMIGKHSLYIYEVLDTYTSKRG